MTEPSPSRPVPGPPRPGPHADEAVESPGSTAPDLTELAERPVAEHVAAYEAEHARLERELGTIDRL
ncbi:UNVERIFIED_ORG: hypothetical protein E4P37_19765 [Bacillus sp. AZ43]